MNIVLIVALVFISLLPIFAIIFFGALFLRTYEVGADATRKELKALPVSLTILLLIVVVASISLVSVVSDTWRERGFTFVYLLLYIAFLTILARLPIVKRQAGSVLLNLGRIQSKLFVIIGFLFIGMGILRGSNMQGDEQDLLVDVLYITGQVIVGLFNLSFGLSSVKVTEQGIWAFWYLVRWKDIERYSWGGDQGNVLTIEKKAWFPGGKYLSWKIPAKYKDELTAILGQRVIPRKNNVLGAETASN